MFAKAKTFEGERRYKCGRKGKPNRFSDAMR